MNLKNGRAGFYRFCLSADSIFQFRKAFPAFRNEYGLAVVANEYIYCSLRLTCASGRIIVVYFHQTTFKVV